MECSGSGREGRSAEGGGGGGGGRGGRGKKRIYIYILMAFIYSGFHIKIERKQQTKTKDQMIIFYIL